MTATVNTVNPATGAAIASYDAHDWAAIDTLLGDAASAADAWGRTSVEERGTVLRSVGKLLTERREEYATLITTEMGKPVSEALAEVDKCAWNCVVVSDLAPRWLADNGVTTNARRSFVAYEPIGVVFAVMPWNFPFWQVLRFACAALAAGNAAVLKHSPNVTGCALAIEQLFADAGAPAGVFGAVVITEQQVADLSARIVADPRVAAVTLTGSERAGAAVASAAGTALKKSVLELGGSDPFVVLDDADLEAAATAAAASRFGNAGQSCVAAKRFVVLESVADEFVRLFVEQVALRQVGDPTDPSTSIGPLARADLRNALHDQVERTLEQGGVLVTGGRPIDGPGHYYEPTVIDRVRPGMAAFREETFGPLAAVVRARDDADAVDLANDTEFGLGASVWGSPERALGVGRRIRSGALFVNTPVASDPRLPFGGTKRSGYGRELSAEGVREFTNIRTVVVG